MKGVWRGTGATLARDIVQKGGYFTFYFNFKEWIRPEGVIPG